MTSEIQVLTLNRHKNVADLNCCYRMFFFTEVTAPPPPRDVFLNILPNNSLSIKWLPPPEEYRIRVSSYVISVLEEDERERKVTIKQKQTIN